MAPNRPKDRSSKAANPASNAGGTNLRDESQHLLKTIVVPTFIMTVFPFLGVLLAVYAQDGSLVYFHLSHFAGNQFTWTAIVALAAWAFAFQKLSSRMFDGPTTSFGFTPRYAANGFAYYSSTVSVFLALNYLQPSLSARIVRELPFLVGNLATVAFVVSFGLWYKGKHHPTNQSDVRMIMQEDANSRQLPIFEFYRGMELHPRVLDVDVKQLINCRVSIALWQILIVAFLVAGYQRNGANPGHAVNVLLQAIYLAKFFYWETGYFNTLDITLDRAGFYVCGGCLMFLPIGYTYSSYYFVYHPPEVSLPTALALFTLGATAIFLNYEVDRQKELFKRTNGKCKIFGRDAVFMEVQYKSTADTMKKSKLLLSGFWGIARHLNYVFELIAALVWNLPGWNLGPLPFFYNAFLLVLLTHRVFRDETKCEEKYGAAWKKYCKAVPYRYIPYVF